MAVRNEKWNHRRRVKPVVIIKQEGTTAQEVVDTITTLEIDGGDASNTGTAYIGVDGGGA